MGLFALFLVLAGVSSPVSADSSNYSRHVERGVGIDVTVLWALPPFKTYEVKLMIPVSDGADLVVGYGRQAWTIGEGAKVNPGTMDSHALILGAKQFLFRTSTVAEYDAWICHDRLTAPDGSIASGWSLSHEFFGGYQFYFGNTRAYTTAGVNAGFWSWKSYSQPKDDRFVWTILPKLNAGYETN